MISTLALLACLAADEHPTGFSFAPANPLARSRSPISVITPPRAGERSIAVSLDADNTVEALAILPSLRLDAEIWQTRVELFMPISARSWLYAHFTAGVSGGGGLDGVVDAWHEFLFAGRVYIVERAVAPNYAFSYRVNLPHTQATWTRGAYLSDTRIGLATELLEDLSVALTLALPTTTRPGYGIETFGVAGWLRYRVKLFSWFQVELGGGAGLAPQFGPLAFYQRPILAAASLDTSVFFAEHHALFALFWIHTPYYARTHHPSLDFPDISIRVGWRGRPFGLFEIEAALTEDLLDGPASDVVFNLSARYSL